MVSIPTQREPGTLLITGETLSPTFFADLAMRATGTAAGFSEALSNMAATFAPLGEIDFDALGLGFGDVPPELTISEKPTLTPTVWNIPAAPSAFTDVLDVDDLLPEPFDDLAPVLVYPSAPPRDIDAAPEAPTVTLDYEEPELEVNLPAAPDLLELNVRPFDGLNIPTFSEEAPVLTAVAPTVREYEPGDGYASSLLTALKASLEDRIVNGGTGLEPTIENAIWDRSREREAIAKQDAIDQLERMERLGFSLPTGAYMGARLRIQREHDQNVVGLSREIAIAQAELEQKNVLAALETSTALEGKLMDYNNAVEQRLFDSARYVTEAGIAIYNAKVQAYTAYIDAYRAKVSVFEAQVRAEVSRVDAYRAEVAAEEAKASINRTLVDQYQAQIAAALSSIDIFKAKIEGIKIKAEIEQIKTAIFGEQVRAYSAQISAYTADIEAYRAQLQAEATKQDVFSSQVEAYKAEVQAGAAAIGARVDAYRGRLDAKTLELEVYKTAADVAEAEAKAIEARNQSVSALYQSEAQSVSSYNDSLVKRWQAAIELARRDAEIGVAAAQVSSNQAIAARQISVDAAKAAAQINSQIGAAALSAVSISQSTSISTSASNVRSYSASNSSAYGYNYSQSVNV